MIRPYIEGEVEDIISCWRKASELAHPFLSPAFINHEADNIRNIYIHHAETWVYENEGKIIGFLSLLDDEVGAIFLDPAYHKHGFGRALMDKAVELRGNLKLSVFEENSIGRRFYKKYGFTEAGQEIHKESGHNTLKLIYQPSPSA